MKLLDIILEDENKDKLIKRGNTIYKGFKTGTLRKGLFGKIMYELPDVYDLQLDVNDDIFIKVGRNGTENDIKFYHVNSGGGEIKPYSLPNSQYRIFVREIERNKFKSFGITLWYEPNGELNESTDNNRLIKKVRSVFKGFKKGLLYTSQSGSKLYYELPDEYKILEQGIIPDNEEQIIFIQVGRETEDNCIKFFRKSKEDENEMVRQDATDDMYENYKHILNLKLKPFNIRVIYKNRNGKWK